MISACALGIKDMAEYISFDLSAALRNAPAASSASLPITGISENISKKLAKASIMAPKAPRQAMLKALAAPSPSPLSSKNKPFNASNSPRTSPRVMVMAAPTAPANTPDTMPAILDRVPPNPSDSSPVPLIVCLSLLNAPVTPSQSFLIVSSVGPKIPDIAFLN